MNTTYVALCIIVSAIAIIATVVRVSMAMQRLVDAVEHLSAEYVKSSDLTQKTLADHGERLILLEHP